MFFTHVRHELTSGAPAAWVAAAGSLACLLQGLLLLVPWLVPPRRSPASRLLWLWLCIHGFANFFGYLLTAPFVARGDVGKLAVLLGWPSALVWAVFGIGALGILAIGALATRPLLRFAPAPELLAEARGRTRFITQIGVIPWVFSAVFAASLGFPAPHWISYANDFFTGAFILGTRRRAARLAPPAVVSGQWDETSTWPWAIGLAALATLVLALLRHGVRIGW